MNEGPNASDAPTLMGSPRKGQMGARLAPAGQINLGSPGSPTTRQRRKLRTRRSIRVDLRRGRTDDGTVWGGVALIATTAPSTFCQSGDAIE